MGSKLQEVEVGERGYCRPRFTLISCYSGTISSSSTKRGLQMYQFPRQTLSAAPLLLPMYMHGNAIQGHLSDTYYSMMDARRNRSALLGGRVMMVVGCVDLGPNNMDTSIQTHARQSRDTIEMVAK